MNPTQAVNVIAFLERAAAVATPGDAGAEAINAVVVHLTAQVRRMLAPLGDGGAAFPMPDNPNTGPYWGMSLRDYFAAKAMQMHGYGLMNAKTNGPEDWDEQVAERAYMTADAMLKARGGAA